MCAKLKRRFRLNMNYPGYDLSTNKPKLQRFNLSILVHICFIIKSILVVSLDQSIERRVVSTLIPDHLYIYNSSENALCHYFETFFFVICMDLEMSLGLGFYPWDQVSGSWYWNLLSNLSPFTDSPSFFYFVEEMALPYVCTYNSATSNFCNPFIEPAHR